VFAANPKYFRGAPVLKKVTARFMPDVSSREFGLQTGELDIIEGLKEDKWIEKVSTFKEVKAPPSALRDPGAIFQHEHPASRPEGSASLLLRAFKRRHRQLHGQGLAVPIYLPALAPPALGALTKDEALKAGVVYDNNIEQAKKLLAEAGFRTGSKPRPSSAKCPAATRSRWWRFRPWCARRHRHAGQDRGPRLVPQQDP